MSKLTQTDIDQLVKEMNAKYQPASGKCVATPAQMNLLIKHLENYTDEVADEADTQGIDDDNNVQQWASDMANWQQRLAHYRAEVADVPKAQWNTAKGCNQIYETVVAPLLSGVFYEVLPGIVYSSEEKARVIAGGESNRKPPDVHVPFSLGNQVLVYQAHQEERARLFWEDLKAAAKALGKELEKLGKNVVLPIALALLGIAAVVGVGYYIYQDRKKKKKSPKAKMLKDEIAELEG